MVVTRLEAFLVSRELTCREETRKLYRHNLTKFEAWLDERAITPEHTSAYLRALKARGLADETLRNNYRNIKTYCRYLVEHDYLDRDPFTGRGRVLPLPIKRRRRKTYTEGDIVKLLQAVEVVAANKRNRANERRRWSNDGPHKREQVQAVALVLLLADSGMRAGEVAALTCGRVRAAELVVSSKGGHEDIAFVSEQTRAVLHKLAEGRADAAPLFRDWHGEAATPRTLRSIIKRLAKRAEIQLPARPLHAFRHYACREWVKAGLNDLTIQQIMRHSQLSTTQIYTQLDTAELERLHRGATPVPRLLTSAEYSSVG